MDSTEISNSFFQKALNEVLCCPECKGDLTTIADNKELKCLSCFEKYRIDDGISVLMPLRLYDEQKDEKRLREVVAEEYRDLAHEGIINIVMQHHCLPVMAKRASDFIKCFDTSMWILDIGCGTGWCWRNTRGGNLILVDFEFGNLKAANSLLENEQNIILVQADARRLPIKTSSLSGI